MYESRTCTLHTQTGEHKKWRRKDIATEGAPTATVTVVVAIAVVIVITSVTLNLHVGVTI